MPKEIKQWITVNGQHIPIYEGESKEDAVNRAIKNKDEDDKEKQIAKNKKQADTLNKDKKEDSDIPDEVKEFIENKQFSKFGAYLSEHYEEYGFKKSQDHYVLAYEIIQGKRDIKRKTEDSTPKKDVSKVVKKNNELKEAQLNAKRLEENNIKNGPDPDDVISAKQYFADTSVEVTNNLAQWVKDSDKVGISRAAAHYMDNSSINGKLKRNASLTADEKKFVTELDKFSQSSTVQAGSVLYSGVASQDVVSMFSKKGEVNYSAFMSTSPDPIYARGYSANTDTMLKIEVTKGTKIGKMYYSDSTGTEGVLGRNTKFQVIGESYEKVGGEKVKVIKVRI